MKFVLQAITIFFVLHWTSSAPLNLNVDSKNLEFLDYLEPDLDNFDIDSSDYVPVNMHGNDLSRSIPPRKPVGYNSPIYYIRLPPQPYMFVPGIGYVSPSAPSPVSQFVNLPMPFVANGKPNNIYQWSGSFQSFPTQTSPTNNFHSFPSSPTNSPMYTPPMKPIKKPLSDSTIKRIPGTFPFNGKPEEIFVLRDSYNSLYSDVLHNVYP